MMNVKRARPGDEKEQRFGGLAQIQFKFLMRIIVKNLRGMQPV